MDFLIVVEDLEVKYAPEIPPVLHGVLLSIESREKIGFLRRTRSGESTITMSILRLVSGSTTRLSTYALTEYCRSTRLKERS